jgi:hypothetical protein
MSQTIKVTVHTASEQTNQTVNVVQGSGKAGQPTHIRAIKDARYQLQDVNNNNVAPEKINAKRVGKNLHLSLDAGNEADLIIDGYYDVHTTTDSGSIFSQMQDGSIHEYIASSTANNGAISSLTDGGAYTQQVLSTEAIAGFELSGLPAVASAVPGYIGAGAVGTVAVAEVAKKEEDPIELTTLRNAAENNSATATTITAQTYAAAGITGVTDANVAAINSALNSAAITGTEAGGRAQLQAIVDAYNAILANADGTANNASNPTQAQYAAIGVTGVSSATTVSLLGDVVDSKPLTAVDTVDEVQALANAANAVMTVAAGGPAPTLSQLQLLGITGVTEDNMPAVLAAIAATADDGIAVDTVSGLQGVVNGAVTKFNTASTAIENFAQDNGTPSPAPTAENYTAMGVTGIGGAGQPTVAQINSALATAGVTGAKANTAAEVQAIVDGFSAIVANADGTANNASNPTQAQYAAIGVTGVSSANAESLLGDVVDGKPFADVDTVSEVQALANAANAVLTGAAGGTAPTLAQLQALGITGVTADNLPAVLAAIKATPDDGSGVNTLSALQGVVTTAATAAASALTTISTAAQNDTAGTAPALADFTAAGVTGVDSSNLAAVSSALNSAGVNGTAADTTAEVQAIVNAFNAIKANADGTANNNATNPTQAQYAAIGVTGVSSANAESLLGDVVDGKPFADVDTVSEVQALANAANAVLTGAAGGTAPTLAQLQALGITNVNAANLADVQAAIAATADNGSGVNTLAALQAVVTAVNDSPVLTPNATARSYTENAAAIAANDTLTLIDEDSANITGATVQITTGLTTGDVLAFTAANGISATYDSAAGKLTLSGTATVAQYEAALRAVTYSSTSENPGANASRTLTWQVNDGASAHNLSIATTSTINVSNVNDAPVLADTTLTLASIFQGAAAPTGAVGSLVSSLVGGVSDADTGAVKGVAITSFDSTNGKLFFSTNGGTAWTEATGISDANALLLASDSDNRIYFQPNSTFTGTSTAVTLCAWDQTTGTDGAFATTATNGGTSAFSAATDTVSVQVVRPVTINAVSTDNIVAMNEAAVVSGKADANATVTLNVGGTQRTVTANGSGDWSYTAQVVPVVRYVMVRRDLDGSVTTNGSTDTGVFSIADIAVKEGNTNLASGKAVTSGVGTVTREAILGNATNSLTDGSQSTIFEITTPNSEAWVQVDLGGYFRVDQVLVTARSNWVSRLNGSKVYMSSTNLSGKTTAELDADAVSGLLSKTIIANATDTTPFVVNAANSGSADFLGTITASESVSGVSSSASTSVSWRPADKITIISAEDNTIGSTPLLLGSGATTGDKTLTLRGTLVSALTGDQRVAIWSNKDPVNGVFIGEATVTGTTWEYTLPSSEFPSGSTTVNRGYEALLTNGHLGAALATSTRFFVNVTNATAPVVIDLNRDGELAYADVVMDVNGDGHLDQTVWAGSSDGVLVWDKFADGQVHNNSQYAFAQYKTTANADGSAATDLQGLAAAFDTNQDGVFDAKDAKFAEFKVWQDANQNGVSDAGEVRSLADVGITSINLTSDGVQRTPAAGVTEAGRTTAVATDGSEVLVADAAFEYTSLAYTADAGHLNLSGAGMNLDLSSVTALHGPITEVNLNGTGANTLKINLDDVLTGSTIKLQGGSDDTVALFHAEGWSQAGTSTEAGVTYNVWHHTTSAEQLLIDQHMQVTTA